jgi:hypothetical protein
MLRAMHPGLVVGELAISADETYWVSSEAEDEPSNDEHDRVYRALTAVCDAFSSRRLADAPRLSGAHIVGDFWGNRSECLVIDPGLVLESRAPLPELLGDLQRCLQQPGHAGWRVGYFEGDDSLVVYAGSIFLGAERFDDASSPLLVERLDGWLAARASSQAALFAAWGVPRPS